MRRKMWVSVAMLLAVGPAWAQQPASASSEPSAYVPSLTFDIVSIHDSPPADSYSVGGSNSPHSSTVNLTNMNLQNLIGSAYGVNWDQIDGLPEWARRPMYNVQAKSDSSVDAKLAKLTDEQGWAEKKHMFQMMLSDRFQLKTHWETRTSKIYEMTVSPKGLKLQPAGSMPPSAEEIINWGDGKVPQIYQRGDGRRGYEFIGHSCSTARLASMLTGQMKNPVVDKTGLTGTYDFVLKYHGAISDDENDDPSVWPALDVAVPDELGLKLKASTGDKKFLVIDHVEKPSAN
jgi:uncharacterized protein (TIGR03435 family)